MIFDKINSKHSLLDVSEFEEGSGILDENSTDVQKAFKDINDRLDLASDEYDGLLSSIDKMKLDTIEEGANNFQLPNQVSQGGRFLKTNGTNFYWAEVEGSTGSTGGTTELSPDSFVFFSIYEYFGTQDQTQIFIEYEVGMIIVYLNGSLLSLDDYEASNGFDVTFNVPLNENDNIKIIEFDFLLVQEIKYFSPLEGTNSIDLIYNKRQTVLFKNGRLVPNDDISFEEGMILFNDDFNDGDKIVVFKINTNYELAKYDKELKLDENSVKYYYDPKAVAIYLNGYLQPLSNYEANDGANIKFNVDINEGDILSIIEIPNYSFTGKFSKLGGSIYGDINMNGNNIIGIIPSDDPTSAINRQTYDNDIKKIKNNRFFSIPFS